MSMLRSAIFAFSLFELSLQDLSYGQYEKCSVKVIFSCIPLCDGNLKKEVNTSLSVCQVARATGDAKCQGSKLHKEVTEIKVYWFVCLNTFKIAKSKNGLFET